MQPAITSAASAKIAPSGSPGSSRGVHSSRPLIAPRRPSTAIGTAQSKTVWRADGSLIFAGRPVPM